MNEPGWMRVRRDDKLHIHLHSKGTPSEYPQVPGAHLGNAHRTAGEAGEPRRNFWNAVPRCSIRGQLAKTSAYSGETLRSDMTHGQ